MRREREAATQQLEEEAEVRSTGEGLERPRKGLQLGWKAGDVPRKSLLPKACVLHSLLERMWLWGLEIRTEEMCEGLRKMGWVRNLGFSFGSERQYEGSNMEQSCTGGVS